MIRFKSYSYLSLLFTFPSSCMTEPGTFLLNPNCDANVKIVPTRCLCGRHIWCVTG